MKNILNEIRQNKYFLLFVFLFGYAQSIQIRLLVRKTLDWYIFTPEAAILSFISAGILFFVMEFFMKHWQKSDTFSTGEALKIFSTSMLVYLAVMKLLGLCISLAFNTFERNFNQETLILSTLSEIMDTFIYGSFFLAFYYYQKNKRKQKQIDEYNQAFSEAKISQLKSQLNPHFLFNNLNVLDQLINEDQYKASDFLNEFADIYRYVLQVSDKSLISIDEEISFAKKYFNLMQHKYGNAYLLEIQNLNIRGHIIPLTLQLLLENAIQHNLGTEKNPVLITISADSSLVVSNNTVIKRNTKSTSGRALNNLRQQYALLAGTQFEIVHTENEFSVTLPIIP
ncbi:sensor histidine kinase [Chryseobacterium sp.]|uniref:sensor histidine kinase n=1 Tax=Chryseobacterium sp. TaxID=1871047 RepID=UPI000EE23881|nr:sensor histidine kinase [Chryseobacterium sp.]HCA08183.1 histidine kinase [Chryseobacterium sp.]